MANVEAASALECDGKPKSGIVQIESPFAYEEQKPVARPQQEVGKPVAPVQNPKEALTPMELVAEKKNSAPPDLSGDIYRGMLASTLEKLAARYNALNETGSGKEALDKSKALRSDSGKDDNDKALDYKRELSESLVKLGRYQADSGDFDGAAKSIKSAIDFEGGTGVKPDEHVSRVGRLADLYKKGGHFELAEPLYKDAVSLAEKLDDPWNKKYYHGRTVQSLALFQVDSGRPKEALKNFEKAQELEVAGFGRPSLALEAYAAGCLADMGAEGDNAAKAEKKIKQVLEGAKRIGGDGTTDEAVAMAVNRLTNHHVRFFDEAKIKELKPMNEDALKLLNYSNEGHGNKACLLKNLAMMELLKSDGKGAVKGLQMLDEAAQLGVRRLGIGNADVQGCLDYASSIHWLNAKTQIDSGDHKAAAKSFDAAIEMRTKVLQAHENRKDATAAADVYNDLRFLRSIYKDAGRDAAHNATVAEMKRRFPLQYSEK